MWIRMPRCPSSSVSSSLSACCTATSAGPKHLPRPSRKEKDMRTRILTMMCLAAGLASAQTKSDTTTYQPPKTSWGHPDLQGTWTSDDLQGVPVERPQQYGTRRYLTEQELAERAGSVDRQKS